MLLFDCKVVWLALLPLQVHKLWEMEQLKGSLILSDLCACIDDGRFWAVRGGLQQGEATGSEGCQPVAGCKCDAGVPSARGQGAPGGFYHHFSSLTWRSECNIFASKQCMLFKFAQKNRHTWCLHLELAMICEMLECCHSVWWNITAVSKCCCLSVSPNWSDQVHYSFSALHFCITIRKSSCGQQCWTSSSSHFADLKTSSKPL